MEKKKQVIWDCNSSLYDSCELKSFEKQLNSALTSTRSLSMPHLSSSSSSSDSRSTPPASNSSKKQTSSKLSRWSIHRLFRAVFGAKNTSTLKNSMPQEHSGTDHGFYVFYDRSGVLSTIPEVPEFDHHVLSPEICRSLVMRRSASDRFASNAAATSVGISCSSFGISGHFSI